jgi:hypothetical protein
VSDPRGTLSVVAEHLATAISPLEAIMSDDTRFAMAMARLGWDTPAVPASYAAIAAAAADAARAAEGLAEGADLDDAVAVLEAVGGVYAALEDLDEAPAGVDRAAFLAEAPRALFEHLLADHLAQLLPGLLWPLRALGVIAYEAVDASDGRPSFVRTRFDWEALPAALGDPAAVPAAAFGWGDPEFDFSSLLNIAGGVLDGLRIATSVDQVDPTLAAAVQGQATGAPERPASLGFTLSLFDDPALQAPEPVGLSVVELPAEGSALPGVLLLPKLPPGLDSEVDVDDWTFALRSGTDLGEQLGVVVRPGETAVRYPFAPGRELPEAGFGASLAVPFDPPRLLLGEPGGIRVELASVTFALDADDAGAEGLELTLGVEFGGLAVVLSAGSMDSFLGSVLGSSEVRVDVPFALSWSSLTGVGLASDIGFSISLHPEIAVGGVRVDRVDLALALTTATPELALRALAAISGTLGPVSFAVDGLGGELPVRFSAGNAGPFDISFAFVPPTGMGLGVDVSGVVTGGGFLDIDSDIGRYAGIGEVDVLGVGIVATGILETQIPGAPGEWSLFLSLAARFTGIQLGFGFTLNGAGGLVGIDRGLDDDALGEAVRSGSLDSILFPENAIAQATQILAEIDSVFPTAPGQYVFGPIVKVGWGTPTLIELDAGVVIQLPDPLTISLLGALSAILPREDTPILELHVSFAGTVNITEGTLKVDASLSGSQVAGLLITGDMAVRAAFLDDPTFLVAFGGFHPTFVPPDDFPELDPVGVSLDTGEALRISLGGYFALTSNSVQVGARAELWAGGEGFFLEGGTSFDAILMFDPFSFAIGLEVWVSVTAGGFELLGVLLTGRLSGPNPWRVAGSAEFRILGFKTSFAVDESFGELANEGPPEQADPSQLVRDALAVEDAWSCLPPPGADPVVLSDAGDGLALHPSGRIQATQRLVPLDAEIECYGTAEIIGEKLVSLEAVDFAAEDVEDVVDWFASAQYFLLGEEEKLSAPSFTQMKAGLIVGGSGADAPEEPAEATFDHEIAYRDPNGREEEPAGKTVPYAARDVAMTRALGARDSAAPKTTYSVAEPLWVVANPDTAESTGAVPSSGVDFFAARTAMPSGAAAHSILVPTYEAELFG